MNWLRYLPARIARFAMLYVSFDLGVWLFTRAERIAPTKLQG